MSETNFPPAGAPAQPLGALAAAITPAVSMPSVRPNVEIEPLASRAGTLAVESVFPASALPAALGHASPVTARKLTGCLSATDLKSGSAFMLAVTNTEKYKNAVRNYQRAFRGVTRDDTPQFKEIPERKIRQHHPNARISAWIEQIVVFVLKRCWLGRV